MSVLTRKVSSCYPLLERKEQEEIAASSHLDSVTRGLCEEAAEEE